MPIFNSLLDEVADQTGREKTWTYDDIYNKYKVSAEDRRQDASKFCDWLQEMDRHGLPTFVDVSKFQQLNCAAFSIPGALEWWAINRNSVSIHYDTTFGTNRSGKKLGLVTAMDTDGHTRILFVTLVAHQDKESFEWVFNKLNIVFKVFAKAIFTDSDPAVATAIRAVYGDDTVHLLCTWHLSLNLASNVKCVAGNAWPEISKKFWQICKNSDLLSRDTFEADFKQLIDLIPLPDVTAGSEKHLAYQNALKWLKKLSDRKMQWAARYTWQTFQRRYAWDRYLLYTVLYAFHDNGGQNFHLFY